ncbi:MAG: DnaD domain protein, partial [Oscillospiraceae bacterium]|nr:DnaD domain protein [Oscillospiraceae bacterium]
MRYKINWGDDVFALPRAAADGLKLASPKAVKILVWLCANKELPEDLTLIDRTISKDDIEDAVNFWTQLGVIADDKPVPVQTVQARTKVSPPRFKAVLPAEIAERVEKSTDIRFLFDGSEQCFGRPLNHDEQRTLIWVHDHLGIPSEVLLMLVHSCFAAGKGQMNYIESVACDWSERGILSCEAAERELIDMQRRESGRMRIMKLLGAERLTAAQKECVERWDDWNIPDDMITHAVNISVEKKLKADVKYIDGIITNWRKDGISSVDAALRSTAEHA